MKSTIINISTKLQKVMQPLIIIMLMYQDTYASVTAPTNVWPILKTADTHLVVRSYR